MEMRRQEWLRARAKAIDAWIAFMMPKLYREQHELTEEMARLFADMCLPYPTIQDILNCSEALSNVYVPMERRQLK